MDKTVRKMSEFVGGGYDEFWRFKGRYRVCKGSRASKKSKTTALWYASWLNKKGFEKANLIVFRKTYRTIKDSCFTDLKWALDRLGLIDEWNITLSPLEMTRKSTGQKILFRGLDDPLKVTSITVEKGYLCWAWLEEAYEIMKEADFDVLDESIRGECPAPLFKQWTITFNPWNERHWLKTRFYAVFRRYTILFHICFLCIVCLYKLSYIFSTISCFSNRFCIANEKIQNRKKDRPKTVFSLQLIYNHFEAFCIFTHAA
jgi:phage terminase large subunit